jgi:hypothetical protein
MKDLFMWFGYVEPSIVISSEIIPTDQYNIFRNDREGSKGGGVLIAVHNGIICSELLKSNNTELIAVKIHHNQRSIIQCHDHLFLAEVYIYLPVICGW